MKNAIARNDLEDAADIVKQNPSVMTEYSLLALPPLHEASANGTPEMLQLLLDLGASVEFAPLEVRSSPRPLHLAASHGNIATATILLQHGANVDCLSDSRETPLFCAAANGHCDMIELLLSHGANINAKANSRDAYYPIEESIRKKDCVTTRLLLDRGARTDYDKYIAWMESELRISPGMSNSNKTECKHMIQLMQEHRGKQENETVPGAF